METIKIKGIDEEIYFTTSKEGLPIYIWKDEYAKSFYLSLNVKYGSIDTEFMVNNRKYKVPNGIAHFMEHIKFNVKKGVTANDLFNPLGSDINAFTTFKYTSYIVYGTNKFIDNLNNLLDYVYNPYFNKGMIKKEKGIIASEINMGKDEPFNNLYFEFNKCLYSKEKYRNLITGEIEDIKNIELEDIKLIYDTFYHPKNMFLVVTGNINPYEVEKIVNINLNKKDIGNYLEPVIIKTKETDKVNTEYKVINANVEVAKAKIGIKINKKEFKGYDDLKLNVILSIILNSNFGDTSDLKEELLQDGVITYLAFSRYVMEDYVVLDLTLESKYVDEALDRLTKALNNLTINELDLKRKINSHIATMIVNYEDVEAVNSLIQNNIITYDKVIDNLKDIYEDISLNDVNEVIKKINTDNMSIVKMEKA